MDQFKVKITPYAREQMLEIRDYIRNQLMNPDAAVQLLLEMKKKTDELQYMPGSVKTIDEQPWGKLGVRKLIVKNFYMYYWIDNRDKTVHVIAVTYAKRNQWNVLSQIETEVLSKPLDAGVFQKWN